MKNTNMLDKNDELTLCILGSDADHMLALLKIIIMKIEYCYLWNSIKLGAIVLLP